MKLFKKMLRDEGVKLVAFSFFMSLVAVVSVAFWPTIKKILPTIQKMMPDMFKWFIGGLATEGYSFFLITQQLIKNLGIFGSAMAIMLGASAIAREVESGTLELLLAQPVSRNRVLTEKYIFGAIVLAIPAILSSVAAYPAGLLFQGETDLINLMIATLFCYSILALIYSLTFCIGTFMDDQMHTISAGLSICLIMTVLVIFNETKPYSFYGWMDVDVLRPIINNGYLPFLETVGVLVLCGVCYLVALVRFRKMTI